MMSYERTPFVDAVEESVPLSEIPNKDLGRFQKTNVFVFEEYFDRESFAESRRDTVSESEIDRRVEEVFAPLKELAESNELVSVERQTQEDSKNWIFIRIDVPDNNGAQEDLGREVGQALKKTQLL